MNFKAMGADGKDGPPAVGISGEPPLARQSSIYSLTFEEFQNTIGGIGKDFGSMNMDEFIRNIWTVEETQAMASGAAAGPASGEAGGGGGMAGLQRQGSLQLPLPRTLSQKTVDEVWRDLFREGGASGGGQGGADAGFSLQPQQRQPTMGEMTLEEFLVRAGVVREELTQSSPVIENPNTNTTAAAAATTAAANRSMLYGDLSSSTLNSNAALALGFPQAGRSGGLMAPNSIPSSLMTSNGVRPPYAPSMQLGNTVELANQQGMRGGMMGIGDPTANNGLMAGMVGLGAGGVTVPAAAGSPVNHLSSDGLGKGNGDSSSLSPVPYVFNGGLRGRKINGAVEKVVERRQRRMIKNRESAARSRARKQAYTMELEAEVAKLKEQNEELQKKQEEILEMQKTQVLEMTNQQPVTKKRCLRRTLTGPW